MDYLENVPEKKFYPRKLALSGATYSVAAVLPAILSLLVSILIRLICGEEFGTQNVYPDWYYYLLFLLPQLSLAATAFFYFYKSREKVTVFCPRCKIRYFFIAFLLEFGLLFSLSELSNLFLWILEKMGYHASGVPLPDHTGWKVLPAILVIAFLPAVMEETLFRGILARNMASSGWGTAATVLVTGAMFSLFHGNPEQTVYQFLCGVCFTLVALRAGSILPTMLAHFLNNAIILILSSFGIGEFSDFGTGWNVALFVVSAICLLGTLSYLLFFDRSNGQKGEIKFGKIFFSAAAVGLAVCAVEWIFTLIAGFYG